MTSLSSLYTTSIPSFNSPMLAENQEEFKVRVGMDLRPRLDRIPLGTHAVTQHSWFGGVVHVVRSGGRVQRAIAQELLVTPGGVLVCCKFNVFSAKTQKLVVKTKKASPGVIASLAVLWTLRCVATDDDPDTDDEIGLTTVEELPKLQFAHGSLDELSQDSRQALAATCIEVNAVLALGVL